MATRKHLAADAWGSLLRVHAALVPAIDAELQRETGLALAWYDVLLELANAPDQRLRMTDLADRVTLSRTRVSRLVDELVVAGYVAKLEHPEDRRSSYAVLSPAGRNRYRAAAPVYLAAIERQFADGLSATDLQRLRDALEAIIARQRALPTLIT